MIQTRNEDKKAIGLVIRTGFLTTKGNLVREILYPKPINLKFYKDSILFIFGMFILSFVGFLITLPSLLKSYNAIEIIVLDLDMITVVVPPALPSTLTVSIIYAVNRL